MENSNRDWSCGIGDEPEGQVSTTSGPLYDKTFGKIPQKLRGWVFGGLAALGGAAVMYGPKIWDRWRGTAWSRKWDRENRKAH